MYKLCQAYAKRCLKLIEKYPKYKHELTQVAIGLANGEPFLAGFRFYLMLEQGTLPNDILDIAYDFDEDTRTMYLEGKDNAT